LIGVPVRAFGAATGVMEGMIQALFFRYESLGTRDYVTDVLIGPRRDHDKTQPLVPFTSPGDSGTLWFYDPPTKSEPTIAEDGSGQAPPDRGVRARRLRPIAMQWGGERLRTPGGTSAFALASYFSSICRVLDVEPVLEYSTGHDEYWGKIGHFAIGDKA